MRCEEDTTRYTRVRTGTGVRRIYDSYNRTDLKSLATANVPMNSDLDDVEGFPFSAR